LTKSRENIPWKRKQFFSWLLAITKWGTESADLSPLESLIVENKWGGVGVAALYSV
jgi:hypothetical protein